MSIPYVKEFAYDLWTTEDGRCWARIRATGEETEISREVMRELRKEEKQLIRQYEPLPSNPSRSELQSYNASHPLSIDEKQGDEASDEESSWLCDEFDLESDVIHRVAEEGFLLKLPPRQADLYRCCVLLGWSKAEYAKKAGISKQRVQDIIVEIQQKLKRAKIIP